MEKPKKNRVLPIILSLVFLGVFAFSAYSLFGYYFDALKSMRGVNTVRELVGESTPRPLPTPAASRTRNVDWTILDRFKPLHELNDELVGWIKIEGTNIDYPVMQSSEDTPEFYLAANFDKNYDVNGLPFLDYRCEIGPNSNHMLVYGHNMKSKIMFHHLTDYESEEHWREHPYILFDTIYEEATYEIFAAFIFDVGSMTKTSFQFHRYTEFEKADWDDFIKEVKRRSVYDTGITPVFGEEILTLATCEYTTWNSRFVVIARRV